MIAPKTNTSYTDVGLTPGQIYYYSLSLLIRGTPGPVETGSGCRSANSLPVAPGATPTMTPSGTATATESETPASTATASHTATPTATVTSTVTASASRSATLTASATTTATQSWTASPSGTLTATASSTPGLEAPHPIEILPNPVAGRVVIWVANAAGENVTIRAFNVRGEAVWSVRGAASSFVWDTHALATGVYVVVARVGVRMPLVAKAAKVR